MSAVDGPGVNDIEKGTVPIPNGMAGADISEHDTSDAEAPVSAVPAVGPPPDGGTVAWLQVIGGFFALFNSWGIINAFGAYETYYQTVLLKDETPSTIAWIGSIQGFFVIAASIVFGRLIDAGYVRSLLWIGNLLITLGLMMTSLSSKWYQIFLAQGVCTGIGCCCNFVVAISVVSSYFSKRRGMAIGLTASGSSIGGVIYPIFVHRLIDEIGFAWATRTFGFVTFGLSIIPCVLMKPRLPPRKSGAWIDYASFKDIPYMIYTFGCFLGFIGLYIPIFFIQSYCLEVGISTNMALYMTSILNAGSIAGRILPNFLADRVGPFNVVVPFTGAAGLLCLCWLAIDKVGGVIVFSILYGFFSGTFVSLPASCIASMTPDLSTIGTRLGMNFFICGFGVLIGTPVGGALIDNDNGGYTSAKIFGGVLIIASMVFMGLSRLYISGPKLMVKV